MRLSAANGRDLALFAAQRELFEVQLLAGLDHPLHHAGLGIFICPDDDRHVTHFSAGEALDDLGFLQKLRAQCRQALHFLATVDKVVVGGQVDRERLLVRRFRRPGQFAGWQRHPLILLHFGKVYDEHEEGDQLKRHVDHWGEIPFDNSLWSA